MLDWLLERTAKEWGVIKGAPIIFFLIVFLMGTLIFFSLEWFHGEKTDSQDKHISLLVEQKNLIAKELEEQKERTKKSVESVDGIAENAELRILFWGEGTRPPAPVSMDNIWKWHIFYTGTGEWETRKTTLFVIFDQQIKGEKLKVSSPDFEVPPYRIIEFNYIYAMIEFSKNLPNGTLVVDSS